MVAPTTPLDFDLIRYERELRGWEPDKVFDLAESIGLSRNWQDWSGADAEKLIEALRSQPLTPAQDAKRWLQRLKFWREERGLSQEAVLQIAAAANLPTDPRYWNAGIVLAIIEQLAKIPATDDA